MVFSCYIQRKLYDEGYIYRGRYEGWYCVSDEVYVASSRVQDGPNGTKVRTYHTVLKYHRSCIAASSRFNAGSPEPGTCNKCINSGSV